MVNSAAHGITVGAGLTRPVGTWSAAESPGGVAQILSLSKSEHDGWWSVHRWRGNRRGEAGWVSASGVALDIDYHDDGGAHAKAPDNAAAELESAADAGELPGNLFHLTPRGARVVFWWANPTTSPDTQRRASEAAAAELTAAIKVGGYEVDGKVVADLARLIYKPNAIVAGAERSATVMIMRHDPYDAEEYAARAIEPDAATKPDGELGEFQAAAAAYNEKHGRTWGAPGNGTCPACGHHKCFGVNKKDTTGQTWYCFSANHGQDTDYSCGTPTAKGWLGSALDLDAYRAGKQPVRLLIEEGLLEADGPAALHPTCPNTLANVADLVRSPWGKRLLGGKLQFNEMLMAPTIDGRQAEDADLLRFRENVERQVRRRDAKTGDLMPLCIGGDRAKEVVLLVANERSHHPVRTYLEGLQWDGVGRIRLVPTEIMRAKHADLAAELFFRWFIAAAARPCSPGCKHDHVLVLVSSRQGIGKSTFLNTLAGDDWFSDSPIDIKRVADSAMMMRRKWIIEWAELETMQRARDHNAIKAFLSSRTDTARLPYDKFTSDLPRTCVFVGSTNTSEFLTDNENRRYWIVNLESNPIDIDKLKSWRDQLWAEAMHYYTHGEPWWLADVWAQRLAAAHEENKKVDPWTQPILDWVETRTPITAEGAFFQRSEIIESVLQIEKARVTPGDDARVRRIVETIPGVSGGRYRNKRGYWFDAASRPPEWQGFGRGLAGVTP